MNWSPQQDAALSKVDRWLRDPSAQQVFRLFGYAGTGKSTLAKHLAQGSGKTIFAAFTGKAAHVMRTKGCADARTIHSLIYTPRERGTARIDDLKRQLDSLIASLTAKLSSDRSPDQVKSIVESHPEVVNLRNQVVVERKSRNKPLFQLRADSEIRNADLLVIDECSMVGAEMAHDLLSFGTKVLVLGDPAQLPPVMGTGYFTDAKPDVLLQEIHRQARDNPIIDLATRVREGKRLEFGTYGNSAMVDWHNVDSSIPERVDQILVGTNKFRRAVNARMRERLNRGGGSPYPVPDDRLVCLRNDREVGVLNGSIWRAQRVSQPVAGLLEMEVEPEDIGVATSLVAHASIFEDGSEPVGFDARDAAWFDYGYALTVHKSQGSQWDDILLFDESAVFGQAAARWLYTGITRAAGRITIARRKITT